MLVSEAVGATLAGLGADTVFGVVGSGNFHVTNALVARGARFVAARHECGAACMADGWARMTGRPGIVSVHQGPGLTNAVTGITEAAKSRTPMLVLAADVAAAAVRSNFRIDVASIATAVGATPERLHSAESAVADVTRAYRTAERERRTVVLALPLDVQGSECPQPALAGQESGRIVASVVGATAIAGGAPPTDVISALAAAIASARRPVFIAGRGARICGARADLERLAAACGALLATSAAAKGLFRGSPWDLDVSGGFASPLAAELIHGADLVVGWGCALNMWTLRHGHLIGPDAKVIQVDHEQSALGAHRPVDLGVLGDVAATARATASLLPAGRIVAVDSGNFMGYPSMYLSVPDADGFCFTQAYQSVGLGLASAIGSAIARPDRLTLAALGDGGALMGISELETVVRLGLPMVILIYDDEAYGAEVHHFGPGGHPLDVVRFPPADIAAIGRGFGCEAITVREPGDLGPVRGWLDGSRGRPLVIDAKVTSERGSWWLEEAFRGH